MECLLYDELLQLAQERNRPQGTNLKQNYEWHEPNVTPNLWRNGGIGLYNFLYRKMLCSSHHKVALKT